MKGDRLLSAYDGNRMPALPMTAPHADIVPWCPLNGAGQGFWIKNNHCLSHQIESRTIWLLSERSMFNSSNAERPEGKYKKRW